MPDTISSAGTSSPLLTVVIMAYNEVRSLEAVTGEIAANVAELGADAEIVIIDDGSNDGTASVARMLARNDARVRVIRHEVNCGLGGVYRTGFAEARGQFLTFFPGDGQFPATIIGEFLARMRERDLILGYLPERPRSLAGRILSRLERLLYRLLFGAMPRFQGVMMIRTDKLRTLRLRSSGRGWAVLMECVLRATRSGWRVESVPTAYRRREHGHSKVNNVRTVVSNMRQVITLWREMDIA